MGDACAGRTPQVESKVKAFRSILGPEGALALLPQFEKLMQFLGGSIAQIGDMAICHNQKMAGCVGKEIKDNEEIFAARNQVIFLIPVFGEDPAKYTAVIPFANAAYVIEAPGCPEVIHKQCN